MIKKIKNFWEIFIITIKRGFGTPSLPTDIDLFNKKLYVRLFRIMGQQHQYYWIHMKNII